MAAVRAINQAIPGHRLNAAAALGLIAKNLRNVPNLKSDHLPRPDEWEEANTFATEIAAVANCPSRCSSSLGPSGGWESEFVRMVKGLFAARLSQPVKR